VKIPHADRTIVGVVKLREYCLSRNRPRGRHKARVFTRVLGFTADDAETLRREFLEAVRREEAHLGEKDAYGQRYVLNFVIQGPKGKRQPVPPGLFCTTRSRRGRRFIALRAPIARARSAIPDSGVACRQDSARCGGLEYRRRVGAGTDGSAGEVHRSSMRRSATAARCGRATAPACSPTTV
jgi:hypothetical protein